MSNNNEHTSLELSKRLHDKGFRGEHAHSLGVRLVDGHERLFINADAADYTEGVTFNFIPVFTFTELWGVLSSKHQLTVSSWIHEHEIPAEAIGNYVEWLIDEGHVRDLIGKGE